MSKVKEIPVDHVFITKNVRFTDDDEGGELMESMEQYGQLQNIGVMQRGERYELVWGHRRLKAAQMNNEPFIEAKILNDVISDNDIPILKLQENIVRKQLASEEIVAAADEIRRRRPDLSDAQIDRKIGKRPGYLSYHRSMVRTYQWLAQKGLKKENLSAMNSEELAELRAKMEGKVSNGTRKHTYHRGGKTPKVGFEIVNPRGPNIVLVCASPDDKKSVLRSLRRLAKPPA